MGIFVTAVQPGSPASLQGLQPGDKILKVSVPLWYSARDSRASREVGNFLNSSPFWEVKNLDDFIAKLLNDVLN